MAIIDCCPFVFHRLARVDAINGGCSTASTGENSSNAILAAIAAVAAAPMALSASGRWPHCLTLYRHPFLLQRLHSEVAVLQAEQVLIHLSTFSFSHIYSTLILWQLLKLRNPCHHCHDQVGSLILVPSLLHHPPLDLVLRPFRHLLHFLVITLPILK